MHRVHIISNQLSPSLSQSEDSWLEQHSLRDLKSGSKSFDDDLPILSANSQVPIFAPRELLLNLLPFAKQHNSISPPREGNHSWSCSLSVFTGTRDQNRGEPEGPKKEAPSRAFAELHPQCTWVRLDAGIPNRRVAMQKPTIWSMPTRAKAAIKPSRRPRHL